MDAPDISVILPFYNAKHTLSRAIESIAVQQFTRWECILVNNNSNDGSTDIAQTWCKKDKRFRLINETEQGVAHAFNKGVVHANGKYIARMDADDESLPNRLEEQYNFLQTYTQYGVVSGMVNYMPHREETEGFTRYVNWVNSVQTSDEIFNQRFIESTIVNPTAMWRKEIGEKHGLYRSGDFPEDYEMWLRWLDKGVKIGKVNSKVLNWYDSNNRLTRTDPIYSEDAFFRIKSIFLFNHLVRYNQLHPHVLVWGASRISRKWLAYIEDNGCIIDAFIDTKHGRQLDKPVIYYKDIPSKTSCFVLVYMKHDNIRTKIKNHLLQKGFREGHNFVIM